MSRQVTHDGAGFLQIRFSFDRRLVEVVKALPSRRWNPADKFWSVPEGQVVRLVELLHIEGFGFDEPTCRLYRDLGGALALEAVAALAPRPSLPGLFDELVDTEPSGDSVARSGSAGDFTVSRLNESVRAALEAAFPVPVWIVGEISGFDKAAHKRIVTFHLAERDEHGKSVAEVGATLFESTRRDIERRLAAAGSPFQLADEITVRMRCRIELYVPWGSYRVIVEELDLTYTLGEAARRREEILRKLAAEGILERNRSLPFPELPLRVGLVTSLGSDAYNDVLRTLQESGFAFVVTAHGARVQGRQTEPSVLNALDWFAARSGDFDVVLLCRGGGSRTDLAWLDTEPLARAVASFPLPVVVGIGHEQDQSALDSIGWRCKTPTAAATFLVDRVATAVDRVERSVRTLLDSARALVVDHDRAGRERARALVRAARGRLEHESGELGHRRRRTVRGARALLRAAALEMSRRLVAVPRASSLLLERAAVLVDHALRRLDQSARRDLSMARRSVVDLVARIAPRAQRLTTLEHERTESRGRRLHLVDPRRVIERGYAVLRAERGGVVTDAAAAPRGARMRVELRTGTLRVTSDGLEEA